MLIFADIILALTILVTPILVVIKMRQLRRVSPSQGIIRGFRESDQ